MSEEDIRAVQSRLDSLQEYIRAIPKKIGAVNLQQLIDQACKLFPTGSHYDHIIQNINKHLPETLTAKLAELQTNCAKLCDPYASHIISEAAAISAQLHQFRTTINMNSMQANIITNLNAIINYEYEDESLDAMKAALSELLRQLHDAFKTKDGMRRWQFKLEEHLKELGAPEYTRTDPDAGYFPQLVRTPENIMREFVHSKIKLCIERAASIMAKRDDEERQLQPTIEGTRTRLEAFCASVTKLSAWQETSTSERQYSGRRLLAFARKVAELSTPAFYYLKGMGRPPTTPQVQAIRLELDEALDFVDGVTCAQEVSESDRQSWSLAVRACVPTLEAYVLYVDPTARLFKKIGTKQFQTGPQELWDYELRKYDGSDVYEEFVNTKFHRKLTKEQVTKDYPDVKLHANA
jgi:hypothetical protein